MPEFIQR